MQGPRPPTRAKNPTHPPERVYYAFIPRHSFTPGPEPTSLEVRAGEHWRRTQREDVTDATVELVQGPLRLPGRRYGQCRKSSQAGGMGRGWCMLSGISNGFTAKKSTSVAITPDPAGKLNVLGEDDAALGVGGAQVGVLEEVHQVLLR